MAAAKLNLLILQGSTFTRLLTFRTAGPGTEIDLTGRTFRGQIRKSPGGVKVADFTFVVQDQVTNTGEVLMSLTAEQTAAIRLVKQTTPDRTLEPFAYDVEQVFLNGQVERILEGIVEVSPEVTV